MSDEDLFKFVACQLCNKPVDIRLAKADHNGKAMHEKCYVKSMKAKMDQNASLGSGKQSGKPRRPGRP
jgi:uncharacterized membrane protein